MPSVTPNKQPLFTAKSILTYNAFDPPIPTSLKPMNNNQVIYEDVSTYGSLITRITVSASGVIGDIVTEKVIYLGIKKSGNESAYVYDTAVMTGVILMNSSNIVPYVEFTFGNPLNGNGLVTNSGDLIVIGASTNSGVTTKAGDYVNVVVEGGTYDL